MDSSLDIGMIIGDSWMGEMMENVTKLEGVAYVMILRQLAARAVSHTRDVSQQENATAQII